MSYRVLFLLASTYLWVQLVFAADETHLAIKEQTSHSLNTSIVTSSTSCVGHTQITTVINKTPPIDVLLTAQHVQSRIVSYLDLETLLTLSCVSRGLYILIEKVFQEEGDLQGFIQWSTKSQKLRFIGNIHYKRAFGMYPYLDRMVICSRPAEPSQVLNIRLARKLVNAEFPQSSAILEINDHLARMRVIEQNAKIVPYYELLPQQ